MDSSPHEYTLSPVDRDDVTIDLGGELSLPAEDVAGITVRLRLPKSAGQGVQDVKLLLQAVDDPSISREIKAKAMMPMDFGN
jgi:hypothetical protein